MTLKKDKILFWLENHTSHFGIAKALADQYECESYGLIACSPKQNFFYKEQKLINFKKTWFLRDHVNLKKYIFDSKKLEYFEKKYSLPLQKIIYSDRSFYKYNFYHKFSNEQIYSIILDELELYEKILDEINPDFVVMRTPEFQDIDLFYELCKSKQIPLLILTSARIGSRYTITSNPNSPILFDKSNTKIEIKEFNDLKKYVDEFSKEHKKFLEDAQVKKPNIFKFLKLILSTYNSSNNNSYRDIGKTSWNVIKKGVILSIKTKIRKSFLDKNTRKNIDSQKAFAYFPLHMEPERSLLRKGQFYTDQINVIKNVSQSLPVGMKLMVKEHPSMQLIGWRDKKFYQNIITLPNVELIHPSVKSSDMIKNSSVVITIASTTALESAFYQKCSVVFSDIDCSSLSSVFQVTELEKLPEIISKSLDTKVNLIELNQFVEALINSSFNTDIMNIQNKMSQIFGLGGFFISNEISEIEMKKFLEMHKESFKKLADEHIKEIDKLKKFNY